MMSLKPGEIREGGGVTNSTTPRLFPQKEP
jgi:hypothetical protein